MRKILIGVKRPNEPIKYIKIEDKLANYQQLIGGYIECVYTGQHLADAGINVYCDEYGKIKTLTPNFWLTGHSDILVGTAIFVKQGKCYNISLTRKDMSLIEHYLVYSRLTDNRQADMAQTHTLTNFTHGNIYSFPSTKKELDILRQAYNTYKQYEHLDLFEAYKKPSMKKRQVWHYWKVRLDDIKVICNNSHLMCIGGIYTDNDGIEYFAYITPAHNYIERINTLEEN